MKNRILAGIKGGQLRTRQSQEVRSELLCFRETDIVQVSVTQTQSLGEVIRETRDSSRFIVLPSKQTLKTLFGVL
jgi:hypothetical protein